MQFAASPRGHAQNDGFGAAGRVFDDPALVFPSRSAYV